MNKQIIFIKKACYSSRSFSPNKNMLDKEIISIRKNLLRKNKIFMWKAWWASWIFWFEKNSRSKQIIWFEKEINKIINKTFFILFFRLLLKNNLIVRTKLSNVATITQPFGQKVHFSQTTKKSILFEIDDIFLCEKWVCF
jgi:hypothetical protein